MFAVKESGRFYTFGLFCPQGSILQYIKTDLFYFLSAQDAGSCGSEEEEEEEEEEEVCPPERVGADQRYDEHMDEAAEEEDLKRYREARANVHFPDEVDTPLQAAAKNRSVLLL